MVIIDCSDYNKLKQDQKNVINKAVKKLDTIINGLGDFRACMYNNPAIHDSYGDFYVYKYMTKGFSVRLLYRYQNNTVELHQFHFKKGDRDNSKYIEHFELYVDKFTRKDRRLCL